MDISNTRIIELKKLEEALDYEFKNKKLLNLAFVHTSYANENSFTKGISNQRLEFLGDAVLELVFTEILYKSFSIKDEGYLTKLRANLVCEEGFSELADELNISEYLLLGKGEEKTDGRNKSSIKSDAFEALNGAIYLDSGYEQVYNIIYKLIKNKIFDVKEHKENVNDYKSMLQEHLHKYKNVNCHYELVNEEGPSHDKIFYINVYQDNKLLGQGSGKSKKLAEQIAAKNALEKLRII